MNVNILNTMARRFGRTVSVRGEVSEAEKRFVRANWDKIPQGGGYTQDSARRDLKEAVEKQGDLLAKAREIADKAERENRDLTADEQREFTAVMRQHQLAAAEVETIRASIPTLNLPVGFQLWDDAPSGGYRAAPAEWIDSEGRPVHVLARGQRLQDLPVAAGSKRVETPHGLGHVVAAIARGSWERCPQDIRAAMSGNDNSLGGVMVPSPLANQVFDYARAASAIWQAGAVTIPMSSDDLTVARQIEDPTMELRGENAAFTLGDLSFDAIRFVSRKIGAVVVMSRELAADAPNAAEVVSQALAKALACEVDRLALVGGGASQPVGLSNASGIGSTGSVGAIAWEDVHAAAVGVKAANHAPNAYICHPTIAGDLDIITSGAGETAAKLWLGAPPSVAGLQRFETTNATTALLFVGDFTKLLIGLRQTAMVEVSTEAGDFFAKHQLGIKITFRFDVNVSHPAAFHVLSGITT